MKKTYKIILAILIMVGISVALNINTVKASTATITESKTVTEGDSVTITANVTAGAWNLKLAGAGQEKGLVGQTAETANANASTKITFTASKVGTYDFTLTGDITDYDTEVITTINKKCTITVKEKEQEQVKAEEPADEQQPTTTTPTKSSNNKLKMLGIKPNDFTNFKPGTTKYYITVPNDVDKVEVYAEKQESSQKISGTGNVELKEGSNTVKVVCTAEDGTTKTYTMYITREKAEEISETIDEKQTEEPIESEEEPQEETTEPTNEQKIGITNLNIIAKTEKGETITAELLPSFIENEYEYQLAVPLNVIELEISVEAQEGTPEIEVMGNKNLVEGENLITVIVKLGEETKVYNITVNKTAEVQENALSSELIMQLAIIAAIATIILVAIIALIIMIVKSKKKTTKQTKSTIDIDLEDMPSIENDKKEE